MTVEIEAMITESGELVFDKPIPLSSGRVRVTIEPLNIIPFPDNPDGSLSRAELRRRLMVAGLLENWDTLLTDEVDSDDFEPVILPPGSPGSEVLVDEDRGPR